MRLILSPIALEHVINVQIVNGNADLSPSRLYPPNPVLTLGGDAVERGLICTTDGKKLSKNPGALVVVNNTTNLAVTPSITISNQAPLTFTITAEAEGFLSNTKRITIRALDSLQYITIPLLETANLPAGISFKEREYELASDGTPKNTIIVTVPNTGTTSTDPTATALSIGSSTVFKDANNTPIPAGKLSLQLLAVSPQSDDAVKNLPGGLNGPNTVGENLIFSLGAALDINMSIGTSEVKTFSAPINATLTLPDDLINPNTQQAIKTGDIITTWSKDNGSTEWKQESNSIISQDGTTGAFKATMSITHLSVWMLAYGKKECPSDLKITYNSSTSDKSIVYIKVGYDDTANQLITESVRELSNGGEFTLALPEGTNTRIEMYSGSTSKGELLDSKTLSPCQSSVTLTNNKTSTYPTLNFDLATNCQNGVFRYSGPILYKASTELLWQPFTEAIDGKLTTKLLEFGKTYDFKIVYKGQEYKKRRTVEQSEFRLQNNGTWDFFGKEATKQNFFTAPTICN